MFGDGQGRRDRARRARLLGAAPQPEGDRGDAGAAASSRTCARRCSTPRCALGRVGELPLGGHGRVRLRRRPRGVLLPRGEHAPAGRARRDRAGHGRRSRGVDDSPRRGRAAGCSSIRAAARAATPSRCACTPRIRRATSSPAPGFSPRSSFPAGVRVDTWIERGTRGQRRSTTRCSPSSSCTADDREQALEHAARRARRDAHRRHRDEPRLPARSSSHRSGVRRGRDHDRVPGHARLSRRATHRGARRPARSPPCRTIPGASATGTSACRRRGRWTSLAFRLANRVLGNAAGRAGARAAP